MRKVRRQKASRDPHGRGALAGEHFQEYFFANATDETIIAKVKELLGL